MKPRPVLRLLLYLAFTAALILVFLLWLDDQHQLSIARRALTTPGCRELFLETQ
jgi:hypothetical protein